MLTTRRGVLQRGTVTLLEPADVPEGTRALVTLLPDEEGAASDLRAFWQDASRAALDAVWDNPEDDVYADLLKE